MYTTDNKVVIPVTGRNFPAYIKPEHFCALGLCSAEFNKVELYLHSPIRLNDVKLSLSTATNLPLLQDQFFGCCRNRPRLLDQTVLLYLEQWWNDKWQGKTERLIERRVLQYHSIDHKSHINYSGIVIAFLESELDDCVTIFRIRIFFPISTLYWL
jgi:hypothetical protein